MQICMRKVMTCSAANVRAIIQMVIQTGLQTVIQTVIQMGIQNVPVLHGGAEGPARLQRSASTKVARVQRGPAPTWTPAFKAQVQQSSPQPKPRRCGEGLPDGESTRQQLARLQMLLHLTLLYLTLLKVERLDQRFARLGALGAGILRHPLGAHLV